jgi:hypothetical protein
MTLTEIKAALTEFASTAEADVKETFSNVVSFIEGKEAAVKADVEAKISDAIALLQAHGYVVSTVTTASPAGEEVNVPVAPVGSVQGVTVSVGANV